MSFRIYLVLLLGVVGLGSPAVSQLAPGENDRAGKLRGKLFCLASYATNVDPERPKDVVEAFFDSPGIAPRELEGIGAVSLPVQTADEGARKWFNQGLACLHGLMLAEAERAFREVITVDPECAMGYWGLAVANLWSPERAAYFIQLAVGKVRRETPSFERQLIEAVARLFALPRDPDVIRTRLAAYADALESIAMDHPDVVELKALLFRQLVRNAQILEVRLQSPWAVDRYASEVLAASPDHPIVHLRRILWTQHRPPYLEIAGLLEPRLLSPDAPGMAWRVLSEAQGATGRWEDRAASLQRAVEKDLAMRAGWFEQPSLDTALTANCVELIDTLSKLGRSKEGLALARALMTGALPSTVASDETLESFWWSEYAQGVWSFAQVCHEHGLSEELQALSVKVKPLVQSQPAAKALLEELAKWTDSEVASRNASLSIESRAARAIGSGDAAHAEALLDELGQSGRAAFLPRAQWIIANQRLGRSKEALFGFDRDFRQQAGAADSRWRDDPVLRDVAAMRRVAGSWPLPARPESITLSRGVATITAELQTAYPSAPEFSLPGWKGAETDLASFRGKPVVVIFYLGAGCYQCMQQLQAFLPQAEAYRKAGISIVAISPDPVGLLEYSLPAERRGQAIPPFTLLSDVTMEVFRRYFVFNDFEQRPMHGTVLIDPDGKVRWSHINNRPFMEPKWLLREIQRIITP